jgi:phosphatidylglycerol:prolipoprotein diacylglycerol transferase
MNLFLYQHLPLYINPIAFSIGSFSVKWYALSYVIAFSIVYLFLAWRIKKGEFVFRSQNEMQGILFDFILVAFFSALIGGRLGYALIYNFSYFTSHSLLIISPFEGGKLTGFYGMSYHGALIGIIIGSYIFLRIKKINFWKWADFVSVAVPAGYFFGRIGNFLNGELYGRITNSYLGMYFAADQLVLRHPSQLYEALLEGLLLFLVLWKMRKFVLPEGTLFSAYLIGYGVLRIFAEKFRQPDPQLGFILGYLTLGQLLSIIMIISGLAILVLKNRKKCYNYN